MRPLLLVMAGCMFGACGDGPRPEHARPKHASGDDYQYGAFGTHRTMDDAQREEEKRAAAAADGEGERQ